MRIRPNLKLKSVFFLLLMLTIYPMLFTQTVDFNKNWYIKASKEIDLNGNEISSLSTQLNLNKWYKTGVPSTVLSSLIENGEYKDLYFNNNLDKIDKKKFSVPWWYRKEFRLKNIKGKYFNLKFNGINYRADIFVNGVKIADSSRVFGTFNKFDFDITQNIVEGRNIIAVKVYPPEKGTYSIGFVDWNPEPPDKNLGIWRTVKLVETGRVSLTDIYIKPYLDTKKLNGGINIYGTIINHSKSEVTGTITYSVQNTDKKASKEYVLPSNGKQLIEIGNIYFKKPKLWWPHTQGTPYLYNLELKAYDNTILSCKHNIRFGIRKIEDYMTKEGFRGYIINGKKILIKGGGWVDDLTLTYDKAKIKNQIKYVKDMNLNTIRLEGFWGNSQYMYDLADENGLLIMVGFSCHWEWEDYLGIAVDEAFNGSKDIEKQKILIDYLKDQIVWLRNHPSIFVWAVGSDKIPFPKLEKNYVKIINKYDGTRPYIAATKEFTSKISGKTGMKMRGPYALTAPVYWYSDTKNGGAFGFNTETGPGAQIPVMESLKKMIPIKKLWPINKSWNYHCARNEFKDISRYVNALDSRYGKSGNLKEFLKKAHVMDYELIRPMFEAFAVNRFKATGIIQWMLNSAWPEMFWQLYDWYMIPTGAYYGTKVSAKPLHIIYRYGYNDIWCVNEKIKNQDNLYAKIKILNKKSKLIFEKNIDFKILANSSIPLNLNVGKYIDKSPLSFISLKLYKNKREIDSNFYWVSDKPDILDFDKTDWYFTPIKEYADLTELNSLPKVKIQTTYKINKNKVELTVYNKTNKLAFFINIKVLDENGEYIIPVSISNNYFSLLPSNKKTISFDFNKKIHYNIFIEGWNTNLVKFKINEL